MLRMLAGAIVCSRRNAAFVSSALALATGVACRGAGPIDSSGPQVGKPLANAYEVATPRPEKVATGQMVAYGLDSGPLNGDPTGVRLAFSKAVQSDGAPWIRLHFEGVTLEPQDYIEIRSLEYDSTQVLGPEDVVQGAVASAYFNGSAVEVNLFVAPASRGSGYQIPSIEVGYVTPPDAVPSICNIDARTLSNDDRVCLLSFQQRVCSNNSATICGCPGSTCNATTNVCNGGTRNGLPCGNAACGAGTCNALATFMGTAFFIRGGKGGQRCLLTAGHNFYNVGENNQQNGNHGATTLHCRVYGCGAGMCQNVVNGVGQCNGGPRNGLNCTPGTTAAPNQQQAVTLVDGEVQAGGVPHDWALLSTPSTFGPANSFELTTEAGANVVVFATGHGADTDTPANSKFQQCDFDSATRAGDVISHCVDTQGGNSGSPVIRSGKAWGIHLTGGCMAGVACDPAMDANKAVFVGHQHAIGAPGRDLSAALAANCPIPTMSEWGMIVLTSLILTGGTIIFGRRQWVVIGSH